MWKSISWVIFCALLFLTSLSAAEPNAKAPAKAVPAGGTSPQDVFEIFRQAVIADDWTTALAQFDEPSRQYLLAGMLGASHMGALGEDGKKLVLTHLNDEKKFTERVAQVMKLPRSEQNEAARSLAQYVKDAPQLCRQVIKLFREQKKENWMLDLENTKLEVLEENADAAKGKMNFKGPRHSGSEPMNFRKIDGRWFLNYNG